ncbi:MAG: DUF2203 domain-containing protein [Halobacteria archaeon]
MGKRLWTLPEARAALPRVREMLERLQDLQSQLSSLQELSIEFEEPLDTLLATVRRNREFHGKALEFYQGLEELLVVGAVVKDWHAGLVDFPARHQGREIFLCWKRGEDTIRFWHDVEAGFQGRQPVELLEEDPAYR